MAVRAKRPKLVVVGIEGWPLTKLLAYIAQAAEYNRDHGYDSLFDCPRAWRAYCWVLQNEWERRGSPQRLF